MGKSMKATELALAQMGMPMKQHPTPTTGFRKTVSWLKASTIYFSFSRAHLAITAFRPCLLSSSLLSFAALALPPFLPSATACGFFRPISGSILRNGT